MAKINVDLTELPRLTNDKFYPLMANKSRYLVLVGGGGSGKSVFSAQKVITRMLSEKNHRFLVLRKVAKTLRESVYQELRGVIHAWGLEKLFKIHKGDLYIKCINGNEILFAGLDDVEKLKSISGVTGIWIEESSEITVDDYNQLDIRLRGQTTNYKQMIISFNPIDVNHWLKKEFFDHRKKNATTIHSTYKDNRFLDDEAKQVLESFKHSDPYYYQVYALGEWGVLGKTIFPAQIVSNRINELRDRKPLKQGYFSYEHDESKVDDQTIKWVDDPQGSVSIYEDVKEHYPYVLGGDTAGDGSDYFTGHIIDNVSGNQVAVLRQQYDEIDYSRQMYCLARHYNKALVGIEVNFSTYPVRKFEEWNYPKMYVREVQDSFTHKLEKRFGFLTGKITRPLIIANLVTIVKETVHLINDVGTLNEMLTFVKNENGKPQAQEGAHDDLIMALAITYHIRDQQTYNVGGKKEPSKAHWTQDMLEDYYNADAEGKAYLNKKWSK
ncbi:MAG: PBSX family phage terminase large subunit [Balneolales bacterium]